VTMAENKKPSQSKKKALPHTMKWMRELTLRQWRHGDAVPDPNRNIHQASEHLDKLLSKMGVSGGMDEQKLRNAWVKVAGDFVSKHAEPESLKKGVLVLTVIQPAMRFHLEQMKGKLLKNFRDELGEGVVKQVRFKVG
jgi:predicted nucleic acid-binding Zn ribbon protein